MKTGRKLIAVLLAVILTLTAFPLTTYGATSGDFEYELKSDGTIKITGYIGDGGDVVIPENIIGLPVTEVSGAYFFDGIVWINSISIPASVTSIDATQLSSMFQTISEIIVADANQYYSSDDNGVLFNKDKTVLLRYPDGARRAEYIIPDCVTSIGDSAFSDCKFLTSVVLPNGVTSIGDSAFSDCESLTSVVLPDSLISIGDSAFSACSSLSSVVIPDSVADMGNYAFSSCSSLSSVVIPDSLTSIGHYAFYLCSLMSVVIPDGVTSIGNYAFAGCDSLSSVDISDSVTAIGSSAFSGCTSLISVVMPDSVTSIRDSVFESCESLVDVQIPDSVTNIGRDAFTNCDSLARVYYTGTAEQWSSISIGNGNESFVNAEVVFEEYPCAAGHAVDWVAVPVESYFHDFAESISCPRCGLETFRISPPLNPEQTLTDDGTGVVLGFVEDVLPATAEVEAFRPQSGPAYDRLEQEMGAYAHRLFEISATDGGAEVSTNGVVLVKIPVPNGFVAGSIISYIIAADGSSFERAETILSDNYRYVCLETAELPVTVALVDPSYSVAPPEEGTTARPTDSEPSTEPIWTWPSTEPVWTWPWETTEPSTQVPSEEGTTERPTEPVTTPPEEGTTERPTEPESSTEPEESAHRYGEWLLVEVVTCDTPGKEQRVCEHCGKIETRLVQPLGHDIQYITVPSTCTVAGVVYQLCNRCGELSHEFLLPLAPHTMGEWEVVKQPTALETGREELRCTVCGALLQTREVELLPDADSPTVTTPIQGFFQSILDLFRRIISWFERLFMFG